MQKIVLETERLTLRNFAETDISDLVPLIGTKEVAATTLRIPHPYEERHAREYLASCATSEDLRLAITSRESGSLIGGIGLHPDQPHRHAELGYWIGFPYWGKGYATEAALPVVAYGFDHLNLARIFASHFEGNRASGNVLRKIGMRHEGCMRRHILKWDRLLDLEMYGILSEEWQSIQNGTRAAR